MGTVVIGIIDDGIAFANARFRNKVDQTRVAHAWRQAVPSGGLFLDKQRIDALLGASTYAGIIDEDEFYQRAGWIDFSRPGHWPAARRGAHGTHVMDLACGYDPAEDRNDRPIVCVQLPTEVTAKTSYAAHSKYPLDGAQFILDCADQLARDEGVDFLPVVINFSYGSIAGPHDGTSLFEAQLDNIVALRKARFGPTALEIVLPAGNSHLSRCHADFAAPPAGRAKRLHWRVQPDDQAQSFLEIWAPCRRDDSGGTRLEVTVTSPTGESHTIGETLGSPAQWKNANAKVYAQLEYGLPSPTGRGLFLVALQPTIDLDPANPIAPAGVWTIDVKNKTLTSGERIQAWIERGDTPFGYPLRGRQSYFDEECYERYDNAGRENEFYDPNCIVTRRSLINSIATGSAPVVIGGLLRKEMVVAKYSAGGPILAPCETGLVDPYRPDAVTPSEDSRVHRGLLAAGSRSGSIVDINGTSVAAPQITRSIADQLAQGNLGDRQAVQGWAAAQEPHPAPAPKIPPLPDPRYGAGRILRPPPQGILDTTVPRPRFIETT
jgi:hypothetical protein